MPYTLPMPTTDRRKRLYGGKTEPYAKVWTKGKAKRRHRLLAEEKLGRPLRAGEVVQHVEGKADVPENLEVYASHCEHMTAEHY